MSSRLITLARSQLVFLGKLNGEDWNERGKRGRRERMGRGGEGRGGETLDIFFPRRFPGYFPETIKALGEIIPETLYFRPRQRSHFLQSVTLAVLHTSLGLKSSPTSCVLKKLIFHAVQPKKSSLVIGG